MLDYPVTSKEYISSLPAVIHAKLWNNQTHDKFVKEGKPTSYKPANKQTYIMSYISTLSPDKRDLILPQTLTTQPTPNPTQPLNLETRSFLELPAGQHEPVKLQERPMPTHYGTEEHTELKIWNIMQATPHTMVNPKHSYIIA